MFTHIIAQSILLLILFINVSEEHDAPKGRAKSPRNCTYVGGVSQHDTVTKDNIAELLRSTTREIRAIGKSGQLLQ